MVPRNCTHCTPKWKSAIKLATACCSVQSSHIHLHPLSDEAGTSHSANWPRSNAALEGLFSRPRRRSRVPARPRPCSLQGVAVTLTLTRLKIRFGTSLDRGNGVCGVFEEVREFSDKGLLRKTCSPVPSWEILFPPTDSFWADEASGDRGVGVSLGGLVGLVGSIGVIHQSLGEILDGARRRCWEIVKDSCLMGKWLCFVELVWVLCHWQRAGRRVALCRVLWAQTLQVLHFLPAAFGQQ